MADIRTETIAYGPSRLTGYLALPAGSGPHPGLVVIHEWWGLNDQVRGATADLANAGYAALAVDLYHGKLATKPDDAKRLAMGLDQPGALADLQEAFSFLSTRPDVTKGRVGSVGWCMGGGYSLGLALAQPSLAACVVYYGRLETDAAKLAKITSPVLGFFGQEDQSIPPAAVSAFDAAMKQAGKSVSVHVYPGAGHAFANPTRTDAYRPEATKDAWAKMMRFLGERLGAA
jgi:carboxymethylenebutenolidase